jgi:hypothetical protein
MKDRHDENLKELHIALKKVFFDSLERLQSEGIKESDVLKVSDGFKANECEVKINTTITNELMYLTCSVNDAEYFKAALDLNKVTYQ